jgi:peptidoglycan/LPS O-acetylase OafA/YrhL
VWIDVSMKFALAKKIFWAATVQNKRFYSLDSVRGISSFIVLTSHILGVLPWFWQPVGAAGIWYHLYYYSPLHLFTAGREAVMIFFALSGFVLTLSIRNTPTSYSEYLIRRIFRIVLPYAASVLVGAALYKIMHVWAFPKGMSVWAQGLIPADISLREIGDNVAMTGIDWHMRINPVAWSLVHEIRISVLMPVLIFLIVRRPRTAAASSILLAIGLFVPAVYQINAFSIPVTLLQTLMYVPVFLLGGALAVHMETVSAWFLRMTKLQIFAVSVAAYVAIQFRWLVSENETLALFANAIGAALVIAVASSLPGVVRILEKKPLIFSGKISYSLYLSHMAVMLLVVISLGQFMPVDLVLPLAVVICLMAAYIFYRLFERPSLQLANILYKRPKANARPAAKTSQSV